MTRAELLAEAGIPLPPHIEDMEGSASVSQWATKVGVNRSTLRRRVTAATPFTPTKYFTITRVMAAMPDVCEGKDRLSPIALRHGWPSQSELSNAMKREFGVRPSTIVGRDWREVVREALAA